MRSKGKYPIQFVNAELILLLLPLDNLRSTTTFPKTTSENFQQLNGSGINDGAKAAQVKYDYPEVKQRAKYATVNSK